MGIKSKRQLAKEQALNKKERRFKKLDKELAEKNKPVIEKLLDKIASLKNDIYNSNYDLKNSQPNNPAIIRKIQYAEDEIKKLNKEIENIKKEENIN